MGIEQFVRGDYIRVRGTRVRGRVLETSNWAPYRDTHLQILTHLGPEPMRFINAPWVRYLVHGDDTIGYHPADLVEKIEPFVLDNSHERRYFRDRTSEIESLVFKNVWRHPADESVVYRLETDVTGDVHFEWRAT